MGFTPKLLIGVGLVWLLLAPPLFTNGACTKEFNDASAQLARDQGSIRSSVLAGAYWSGKAVPHTVLSPEACRKRKPRTLDRCGDGALVIAKVPVSNAICRIYRDDEIRVWLQYDSRDRLARMRMDMSPYKSLPLPVVGGAIHWGR